MHYTIADYCGKIAITRQTHSHSTWRRHSVGQQCSGRFRVVTSLPDVK